MSLRKTKRFKAGCMIGFGMGILLVLFLSPVVWLFFIGVTVLICGIKFLFGR